MYNISFSPRRKSRQIHVGKVAVGGDAPISVQSMTNTPTEDIQATIAQIQALQQAGADIVRVSVPTMAAAEAFGSIKKAVQIPLVADIHFDYKIALKVAEQGADCLRLNPGNIGAKSKILEVVSAARDHGISMRIGVNAGSLEKDLLEQYHEPCAQALVESALRHAAYLWDLDFHEFKISVKASDVRMMIDAYRLLAEKTDVPLHLGVTEAGGARFGAVKSAIGIGALLLQGVGDTLRVSLSADPVEEVRVGFDILKSLGLRHRGVNLVACPSCARQEFDVIATVAALDERLADITEPLHLSVIGCVVNGPGEALVTQVGVTGAKRSQLYINGKLRKRLDNDHLVDEIEKEVRQYLKEMA